MPMQKIIRLTQFILKHSISCQCGESWHLLADSYDYRFELHKAAQFLERIDHRRYDCMFTPEQYKEKK